MRESVASFGVTRSTLDAPLGLPALPAPSTARAFANERPPGFRTTWLTWATSEEFTVVREERVDSKNVPLRSAGSAQEPTYPHNELRQG